MQCSWCGTNAEEAAKRHEGPHATWCVHFREDQRGGPDRRTPMERSTGNIKYLREEDCEDNDEGA